MNWYVSTDKTTWTLCSDAGICNPVLTFRANGLDELTWQMPGSFDANPAYASGTTIYLASGVTSGTPPVTAYTIRFIGRITSIPVQGAVASEVINFRAAGGWWWLEQITYAQVWQVNNASGALVNNNILRVILGQADDTTLIDSGAQIAAVLDYAVNVGAPIAKGTVDSLANLPLSEHICLRCSDVIRQLLRFQPDVCCWFDYSSGTPTFNCRKPANLATITVPTFQTDVETISMTPRYDLQMPGLKIMYEQTNAVNETPYRSIFYDIAPSPLPTDPRIVGLYFELQGSSATVKTQKLVTAAYPASPYTDKTFWRTMLPWLNADNIADADLTITNVSRTGIVLPVSGYTVYPPKYVKEGAIPPWMVELCGIQGGEETWTATIAYTRKSGSGATVEEQLQEKVVKVTVLSTNADTKEYQATTAMTAGEPIPTGLAAALYASWSRLHWDGDFSLVEQETTFQCLPGNLVNLSGSRTEWATMAALVQDVTIDLQTGTSKVKTGTCGRLEAETLVALVRASHMWKVSYNWKSRDDADQSSSGNTIEGGQNMPRKESDSADPGQAMLKRWTAKDASNNTHVILADPTQVSFAVTADKAAKTLQPTEVFVAVKNSGGGIDAKPVQAIACTPYGSSGSGGSVNPIIPDPTSASAFNVIRLKSDKTWEWGQGLPDTSGVTDGYGLLWSSGTVIWGAVQGTPSCSHAAVFITDGTTKKWSATPSSNQVPMWNGSDLTWLPVLVVSG